MNNTSLKEYYIRLQKMYNDAVTMLTAINTSLTTSAPEIEVPIADTDDASSKVRIPSFIYLENKLEELNNNINTLFNIPEDGEAWFTKSSNMYKLNLVRSNTAPLIPQISTENIYASISENNFLKDLVFPKTFIRFNIDNLPDNISNMFMKKIIINDSNVFSDILKRANENNIISYSDCKALLYTMKKGIDYDEYDSVLSLPIKKDYYKSAFKVLEVIDSPWQENEKNNFKVRFDTLYYSNEEDSSITYRLKENDLICLGNTMSVFKIKSILTDNTLILEEYIGYANIDTYENNTSMVFQIYIADYSKFHYVDVPLEENEYVIIFLGTIWNNVRSILDDGICVDLTTIDMYDKYGNPIKDSNGNQYKYISYYKDFCTNLGDLIYGMSKTAYSQITNYNDDELKELFTSDTIKAAVNSSINTDTILKVVAINKHLVDDASTEEIINLHNQKNEITSKLQTCQSNIDQVYSTMLTTDFSQNVTVTQQSLQEKIQGYYSERTLLQKQLNSIIENINVKSGQLNTSDSKTKYRIRGITDVTIIENYLQKFPNVSLIAIDVEYKYSSTNKDTATLTTINNSTFTNWNKYFTIEKERILEFTDNGYSIKYADYSNILNNIKWNQIDIPIKNGEDVKIRIRYKYSIGQPFIDLYTPWTDEITVVFPTEFKEDVEVKSILETNDKDSISATFNKTLIDEGYTEHIQNKVLSNEQVFFHMPENIYSGFNTAENNLISLKDKLTEMVNDIENYKKYIDSLSNTAFEIYLNYDDNSVLLSPNTVNKINIYNTEHITDMFIKKEMNIIIKNTGNTRVNLYSLFPGNTDQHLITADNQIYTQEKSNFERVPLYIGNKLDGQYLSQWIYFRQNNPYSKKDIYFNDIYQNAFDYSTMIDNEDKVKPGDRLLSFRYNFTDYIGKDNNQVLLGFRNNKYISGFNYNTISKNTGITGNTEQDNLNREKQINSLMSEYDSSYGNLTALLENFNSFIYTEHNIIDDTTTGPTNPYNQYILRYEDIVINNNGIYSFVNTGTSLEDVADKVFIQKNIFGSEKSNDITTYPNLTSSSDFVGGFLYPNLISKSQLLTTNENGAKYVDVGGTIAVPIIFEYYVNANKPVITKSLYFDIKNSLVSEPLHYMIEITGNYDYTTTGEIYKDIDNFEDIIK